MRGGGGGAGAQGGAECGGDEGLLMVTAQEIEQAQSGLIRGVILFQRFWVMKITARTLHYYFYNYAAL